MENIIYLNQLVIEEYGDMEYDINNLDLMSFKLKGNYYVCNRIEDKKYLVSQLVKDMENYRYVGTDYGTINLIDIFKDSLKEDKVRIYDYEVINEGSFGKLILKNTEDKYVIKQVKDIGQYTFY